MSRYEKMTQPKKDWLWERLHDAVSTEEFATVAEEFNQWFPKNRDSIHAQEIQVLYEHFQLGKWQAEPEALEDEVKETLGEEPVQEERALRLDEKGKIDELNAHKYVLQELWKNYKRISDSPKDASKISYLLGISKEITEIKNIMGAEKNFLNIMSDVREAEEKETPEQKCDYIANWEFPRLVEKCVGKEELKINLLDLLTKKVEELKK